MALQMRPFLSVDELARPNEYQTSMETLQMFDYGGKVGDGMRARQENRTKQAEMETIANATRQAIPMPSSATPGINPSAQSGPAPLGQTAPAQIAPAAMSAPAQTPVLQQAAPMTQPAPIVSGSGSSPAPTAPVMPSQEQPVPQEAPAAPVQEAAPALAQAPAQQPVVNPPTQAQASAAPNPAEVIANTPVVNGRPNPLSTDVYQTRMSVLDNLVKSGQIRASTADQYAAQMSSAREKQLADAVELRKKVAEIENSEIGVKEKRVKMAAEMRSFEDNHFNEVYSVLKTGDLPAAQQMAKEYGIDVDLSKPGDVAKIENRAKRSSDYKASQTEARAQSEEERKAAESASKIEKDIRDGKEISTKDLPDGYFRATKSDPQVYKMDANGKPTPVSTDEVISVAKSKASAGASRTGGSGGNASAAAGGSGTTNADGTISAIKIDKQGNKTLDPQVVKQLAPMAKVYDKSGALSAEIDGMLKSNTIDNASQSGFKSAVTRAEKYVGLTSSDRREADEQLARIANSGLAMLDSPLMKGAPSEADARRALSVINDSSTTTKEKRAALGAFNQSIKDARKDFETAIGQYDEPTKQRLKGVGINTPGSKAAPAPAGPAKGAVVDGYVFLGGNPNDQANWKKGGK